MIADIEWYEDAVQKLFDELEYHEFGELEYLKETDVRFYFEAGMVIRNMLRGWGFTDDIYGNLDDHYMEILKLTFEKIGMKF